MIDEKLIISHLYRDSKNGQWVIQTNEEHLRGVAELAAGFSGQFGLPHGDMYWGCCMTKL